MKLRFHYKNQEGGLIDKIELEFSEDTESIKKWYFMMEEQNRQRYRGQCVMTMQDRLLGSRGRVYWPGPTKDDWQDLETNQFDLSQYLPTIKELAQANDLLLVEASTQGVDWEAVQSIRITFRYGKVQRFSFNEDDAPEVVFLAPVIRNDDLSIKPYEWRATFTMHDKSQGKRGKVYAPGPTSRSWAKTNQNQLWFKEYIMGKSRI